MPSSAGKKKSASTTPAFAVDWTDDLPDLHLLRLTLEDHAGRTLSANSYWRPRPPAAMKALNDLPRVSRSASITGVSRSGTGTRRELTAVVKNRGSALAPMVFFFNDTAPTEIYTLSLHDALPI